MVNPVNPQVTLYFRIAIWLREITIETLIDCFLFPVLFSLELLSNM
jgi:hypothetical protein